MKSNSTFQIELNKLHDLMAQNDFEQADKYVTRMLESYNRLDYDLLLKKARIR